MADAPQTSFIPKQTTGAASGKATRPRRYFNVFGFIGSVIFLGSLVLAVGVYIYKDLSEETLAQKKLELDERRTAFSAGDIQSIRALDRRISVARTLLDAHLSPSLVFDALERRVVQGAYFNDFIYDRRESGSVEIVLNGEALRFNTLALLGRQLSQDTILRDFVFSDLAVTEADRVGFGVVVDADTAALRYMAQGFIDEDAPDAEDAVEGETNGALEASTDDIEALDDAALEAELSALEAELFDAE